MGFMSSLFGGSEKLSDTQVHTLDLWNEDQKRLFAESLMPYLTGDPSKKTGTPYTGKVSATLGSAGLTSLDALEALSRSLTSGSAGSALDTASKALQGVMTRGPEDFNQYFDKAVYRPALEAFNRDVMPGISRRYAPSDFYSGARIESENRAVEDFLKSTTQARAQTGYQARESDLNRILQAAATLPGVVTAPAQAAATGVQAAAIPAAFEQQGLSTLYQDFVRQQRNPLEMANLMLAALGLKPIENVVVGPAYGQNQGSLGGILQGAAAIGGLF